MAEADKPLPGTPDPVEIAMARVAGDASLENPARLLLAKQNRLIDAQIAQLGRHKWRDWFLAALAALLLGGIGAFVWSASRADGVVIQPFAVPPDLARRGLSGDVVAAQLLDKLTAMQAGTESVRASSTYANDWGDDVKVEVPYAGVSIGELRRVLRNWLGKQTRLSGEVVRLPDGRIAVTTRAGSNPAARVEGAEAEFDALLQKGAEGIYRTTQPYRYAAWLGDSAARAAERTAVLTELSRSKDINERLWAMHGLSLDSLSSEQALGYYRRILAIRPDFHSAIGNLPFFAMEKGHEEEAYRLTERVIANVDQARRQHEPGRAEAYHLEALARNAAAKGDMLGAASLYSESLNHPVDQTNTALRPLDVADRWADAHDAGRAMRALADAGLLQPGAAEAMKQAYGVRPRPALVRAVAVGDWSVLRDELAAVHAERIADISNPKLGNRARRGLMSVLHQIRAELATAQARTGRVADAMATVAQTPADHDEAIRARGWVAAMAGRAAESDRWFARAVASTPSLPAGHAAWAETLLALGEFGRAIEQARLAHGKGPRWADPLKIWGDALGKLGRNAEAVEKYEQAAERAPRWGALHFEWGKALWRLGRRDEARAKFAAASRMGLNPADRALLQRIVVERLSRRAA